MKSLKPENLLIDSEGYPKLVDFGLSIDEDSAHVQSKAPKNYFVGTLDYSAPEIFKRQKYSAEQDVWALGCLIYEMVVGVSPFASRDPRKVV